MHRSASYVFGTLVQLNVRAEPRLAEAAARTVLGEFDRLHLGAEGTAEHPLDQAFDATLEVA